MSFRGLYDRTPALEDENSRARAAALDQRLSGRRLELTCSGGQPIQLLVVEVGKQRQPA
jgi:hypothetical protein